MRALVIAALLLAVASAAPAPTTEELFTTFKTRYDKKYTSEKEEEYRYSLFTANMRRAAEVSRRNPSATFGMNKFADLSREEMSRRKGLKKSADVKRHQTAAKTAENNDAQLTVAPTVTSATPSCAFVDWRLKGAVTAVKNQGDCGGCWAFSSTGALEGQWFLAGHKLTSLSEQVLLSCDTVDLGCNGGDMQSAYNWFLSNTSGRVATSKSYPFTSIDDYSSQAACQSGYESYETGAVVIGWRLIASNEAEMATFLCYGGPISIAIDANDVEYYTGGIMTTCSRNDVDHGVLIVGMDLENTPPYWIIKNSWAADWGEDGYFRVEYGFNECDITNEPTVPIVA